MFQLKGRVIKEEYEKYFLNVKVRFLLMLRY